MSSTPQVEVRTPVSRLASTAGLSSDYISPTTRRRPIPLTSQSSILSNFAENDDAAEKRQRRHSRVMEMQRHLQSPVSSPSDRRRSLPLSGLSTGQLTDHYSNCIKLSAENKINSKNAFGLHLIDYMAELLKSKKGEMTNFQVASCTLDASAKIYAGRVDAIHAETYKMLGGLGHDRQNKQSEGDAEGEGPDANDGKKKKRARHSNTVETNLKNINVTKLDLGFEPDPLFQRTSAAFDEGGSFGLLLNHLQCRDDGCELLLDSNTIINNEEEPSKSEKGIQTMVDMSEITEIYNGVSLESLQICPEFADFKFTNWNADGEEGVTSMISKMAADSKQAFDVHAIPEPLEEEPADHMGMGADHFEGGGFSDDDDDGGERLDQPSMFHSDNSDATIMIGRSASSSVSVNTGGKLCLQLSLEPSEYSYFNLDVLNTWAGPQHWKLKPKSKDPATSEEGTKKAASKKPVFRLNYDEDIDFDKFFGESKASTTLSQATLNKYNKSELTLPDQDDDYKPTSLLKMFLRPNFMMKRQTTNSSNDSLDDGIDGYDYNNENDCANFCPAAGGGDDDDDDDSSHAPGSMTYDLSSMGGCDMSQGSAGSHSGFFNNSVFDATMLQGDKLVAQPHKVNKIDIQYARTAKRMDVKKLKTHMWGFLTKPESDKENVCNEADADSVAGTQSFCDMYTTLPDKLSKTMSKNLSIPIAFVCLLHLCNEKSLRLSVQADSFEDLLITQD
ncbi:condensin complex subunit 2-like isoform X2 [Lytechinus variegatus]|uniref:condensin complex subunit 2-like isoform X2 n=1 Tax=Lytechinus variegatus TaxID=7654 RepID=UPI001BB15C34|nr:condensin complex subunit 2-like isoform X2 [Lytechinus variegatus]